MITSRIFASLAAALLVSAFALMVLAPEDLSLLQGLDWLDRSLAVRMHDLVRTSLGNTAWVGVALPVLARPVWLVPLCLGLVCVGVATSFSAPPATGARSRKGG